MRFMIKDTIRECSIIERSKSIINIHCVDETQYEIDCKTVEGAKELMNKIYKSGLVDPEDNDLYYIDTFNCERKKITK
ncbi:MAG: hypothetical protein K5931_07730 [Lachnospiraceae bacterium]|nr:hypothetical protein [Lachnospiraceae bacterium]